MDVAQHPRIWHALLIASIGLVLLVGCWSSGPTAYDDSVHLEGNKQVVDDSVLSVWKPQADSTYFPVTILSYKLDRILFAGWMPGYLGSYAPGVRLMSLLYHSLAALILWRVLLQLALSPMQALFIALVFAAHPMACETVCWASERKNTLAALFGYAALWAWFREGNIATRLSSTVLFYTLALMGKPSALGLFPILFGYELMGGRAGICDGGPLQWRPSKAWIGIALRLLPMAAVSFACVLLNVKGHSTTLVPPPGGSIFTALLTDLEIVSRYIFNILLPISLSAVYFVDSIRTILDVRVFIFGALLVALIWASVKFADNSRRAAFGWIFFIGSLGPSLNLIAIPHYMQDRYVYLGAPGLLIVVVEVAGALSKRSAGLKISVAPAAAYVTLLAVLALGRSYVWKDIAGIFGDAVEKQPNASYARFGLGSAYAQKWNDLALTPGADKAEVERLRQGWLSEWRSGLLCPDAGRYYNYWKMASTLAENAAAANDINQAEFYWKMMAYPPPELPDDPASRASARLGLTGREINRRHFAEAYKLAQEAVELVNDPSCRLMRGRAAIYLAETLATSGDLPRAKELFAEARQDLESIPKENPYYNSARELLAHQGSRGE